jgi:hypothetical protein
MEPVFRTYVTPINVETHLFSCRQAVDGTRNFEGDLRDRQVIINAESRVCAPSVRLATRLCRHR